HVIKSPTGTRRFGVADDPLKVWKPLTRHLHHPGADVDANAFARLERRKEFAGSRPELKHRRSWGYYEPSESFNVTVVVPALPSPTMHIRSQPIEMRTHRVLVWRYRRNILRRAVRFFFTHDGRV